MRAKIGWGGGGGGGGLRNQVASPSERMVSELTLFRLQSI